MIAAVVKARVNWFLFSGCFFLLVTHVANSIKVAVKKKEIIKEEHAKGGV